MPGGIIRRTAMHGYVDSSGTRISFGPRAVPRGVLAPQSSCMISAGRTIPPGLGRGLGVIPGPSIQQVTSLPLSPPPAGVQATLAQSFAPVGSGSGSWFAGISAWAAKEAISGTGITNGLLYGGAGFLFLLAMIKGKRMF